MKVISTTLLLLGLWIANRPFIASFSGEFEHVEFGA